MAYTPEQIKRVTLIGEVKANLDGVFGVWKDTRQWDKVKPLQDLLKFVEMYQEDGLCNKIPDRFHASFPRARNIVAI